VTEPGLKRVDDVPLAQDRQLLEQLYRVPLDKPVGPELFTVMASLLAHVLQVGRKDAQ
jgi:type III secretion system FlhB-like substrate exporter